MRTAYPGKVATAYSIVLRAHNGNVVAQRSAAQRNEVAHATLHREDVPYVRAARQRNPHILAM